MFIRDAFYFCQFCFSFAVNLWGFERLTKGPGKGGYARSEHFLRTNRSALCHVHRRKIKCLRASSSKKTSPTEIIPIIATANGDKDNGNNSVGEQQTTRTKSTSIGAASAVVGGHEQQTMKSSSSDASVVSHSTTSDASSVSSDSCDCDQSTGYDMILPTPISEDALPSRYMSEQRSIEDNNNNNCPQTGDCLDFEGRRYFFVDEEELKTAAAAATITFSSTAVNHTTRLDNIALQLRRLQQQFPPEMSIFPTPIADVPMPEIQYW
jgi:hypothetical protein